MTRTSVALLLLLSAACAACKAGEATPAHGRGSGKLEYPVQVAKLEKRHVQYTVTAPGSIEAFQQVQITARVAGAVDKVSFVEGQTVKQGDVLVTIESDRYRVAVDQARALEVKARATQKSEEAELARRKDATTTNPGLIPGEELEQHATGVKTAQADVAAAVQATRVAELNLRDSFVRAPIAGVVQTRTVQTGQYLQPGAVLATLLQRDPMLLRFSVTEQDAPRLKPGMLANLTLRESSRTFTAHITLVSGSADPETRLVAVTAQLDTTEHQYWLRPGAFCVVSVPVGDAREAIVVPTLAVQPTERGNVVYVIDDKNVARQKVVQLGMHTPDGNVEITKGVEPGETIVVRGIEPLSEGAPVKVTDHVSLDADAGASASAAPAAPAAPSAAPAAPSPAAASAKAPR